MGIKMEKRIKKWLKKAEEVKKGNLDLSRDEDLSIAIMNMVSLEEHFYFTAMKTGNDNYLDMLKSIRQLRIKMLKKMVTNPEGEEWCISKHLLASSMRLIEVGTKELAQEKKEEASESFGSAFELYSMFFAINLRMIGTKSLPEKNKGIKNRFSAIVKKIVDCCREW